MSAASTGAPPAPRYQFLVLAGSVLLALGVGAAGSILTSSAIPTWYADLTKPPWNPPSWLFGPVWTVLYVTMGAAAWGVWKVWVTAGDEAVRSAARYALGLYVAQLLVNAIWSPVFFGLRRPDLALIVIGVLWLLLALTLVQFARIRTITGLALVPYLLWVTFASALNAAIWWLNP